MTHENFTQLFYRARNASKNYYRGLCTLEEAINDIEAIMTQYHFTPSADDVRNLRHLPEDEAWLYLLQAAE